MKQHPLKVSLVTGVVLMLLLATARTGWAAGAVAEWGEPGIPRGLATIKSISSSGSGRNLALKANGTVAAWGTNSPLSPDFVLGLFQVSAVAAGFEHGAALTAGGRVVAWGANSSGQTNVPVGLSNVVAISGCGYHNLALKADHTVAGWGNNTWGQLNFPTNLADVIAIGAGSSYSLMLKADGTVLEWGDPAFTPPALSNVTAIAAGLSHCLALKADGTVVAWGGDNEYGQTNVPIGLSNVVAIAAGKFHSLALKANGMVVAWGNNGKGQSTVPSGLSNVTAIAASDAASYAVVMEGTVQITQDPVAQYVVLGSHATFSVTADGAPFGYRWLFNGQPIADDSHYLGSETSTLVVSNITADLAGNYSVIVSNGLGVALSYPAPLTIGKPPFFTLQPPDRTVPAGTNLSLSASIQGDAPFYFQWFFNGSPIAGATSVVLTLANVQPANSGSYSLLVTNLFGSALSAPATVTVTDSPPYVLMQPASQTAFLGQTVSFSVVARGSLPLSYQWRFNGDDIPGATGSAVSIGPMDLARSGYYSVALSNAVGEAVSAKAFLNVVQCAAWGDPLSGGLTNVASTGLTNLLAVAAGGSFVAALKSDHTVGVVPVATGFVFDSLLGVTNVPSSATNVIALAAGRSHILALRSNGTVVAWGNNFNGAMTNVPPGLSNVIAVAAGSGYSMALRANGTVVVWGSQQPNPPANLSNVVAIAAGQVPLALKTDGTVVLWVSLTTSTNVPAYVNNVVAIAGSQSEFLALQAPEQRSASFTLIGWPVQPPLPRVTNLVAVAGALSSGVALKQDGTVTNWGSFGKNPMPAGLSNIFAITAGGIQAPFAVALGGNGSPVFTIQPVSQTVTNVAKVLLAAPAVGAAPMRYQWQLNGLNLAGETNAVLILTNMQAVNTGIYRMIASNPLGTSTSAEASLNFQPSLYPLAAALNTDLKWSIDTTWFGETQVTHDNVAAAQSGRITDNASSTLQTSVAGPGTLSFWWKVSSEEDYDFLSFYLDGSTTPLASISGEVDWEQRTFDIPAGQHTLRWVYSKDGSVSHGLDSGWLDQVVYAPGRPQIVTQPQDATAWVGSNAVFQVVASGAPVLQYQWLHAGTNLPGATASALNLAKLTLANAGVYAVQVSNPAGSVLSSNATLTVRVQQRLFSPTRLPDGTMVINARDAVGGSLQTTDLSACEVQASTDLVNWIALPNALGLTNGTLQIRDADAGKYPARYYRLQEK